MILFRRSRKFETDFTIHDKNQQNLKDHRLQIYPSSKSSEGAFIKLRVLKKCRIVWTDFFVSADRYSDEVARAAGCHRDGLWRDATATISAGLA